MVASSAPADYMEKKELTHADVTLYNSTTAKRIYDSMFAPQNIFTDVFEKPSSKQSAVDTTSGMASIGITLATNLDPPDVIDEHTIQIDCDTENARKNTLDLNPFFPVQEANFPEQIINAAPAYSGVEAPLSKNRSLGGNRDELVTMLTAALKAAGTKHSENGLKVSMQPHETTMSLAAPPGFASQMFPGMGHDQEKATSISPQLSTAFPSRDGTSSSISEKNSAAALGSPKKADLSVQYSKHHGDITTLMIRNVPCRVTQQMMADIIDQTVFKEKYNFLYVPSASPLPQAGNGSNLGYGFINFPDPEDAMAFHTAFTGYRFEETTSSKLCVIVPAHIQGLENNVRHFSRKAVNLTSRKPFVRQVERINKCKASPQVRTEANASYANMAVNAKVELSQLTAYDVFE